MSEYLHKRCIQIANHYGIILEDWNHDEDHVHLLVRINPNVRVSDFIRDYKSSSSRDVKKQFDVTSKLWSSSFWSRGYFVCSTGGVTIEIIKKYIEEQ